MKKNVCTEQTGILKAKIHLKPPFKDSEFA